MNFLNAIRHAAIGYGIRRKSWDNKDTILCLDNACELRFLGTDLVCGLLKTDAMHDRCLSVHDLLSTDWETV